MVNFGGYCKVPNLVVREHMKFIKETLRLKTVTVTTLHEKRDKENIHNYLAVLF
jgi:hypothetical protein